MGNFPWISVKVSFWRAPGRKTAEYAGFISVVDDENGIVKLSVAAEPGDLAVRWDLPPAAARELATRLLDAASKE